MKIITVYPPELVQIGECDHYITETPDLDVSLLHPRKQIVNIATMRSFSPQDYLIQRKYDGELATRELAGAVLLGELVKYKSGGFFTEDDKVLITQYGEFFAAFTVAAVHGENILHRPTRERWGILCSFAAQFPPDIILAGPVDDVETQFLNNIEGICAHDWDAPWGNMFCVKVNTIFVCRVTATGGTQSVGICDAETGQDRGHVKLGGGKCDNVRTGTVIRVEAMGLTDAGKLRQPVPCRDWLVKY